jgi:arylsulfatase A-like enzyme
VDGGDVPLPAAALEDAEDTSWLYRGVRTGRYTYVRYLGSGEVELYDRVRDPWQLRNVAADSDYAAVAAELAERTRRLSSCSGDCVRNWGQVPAPRAD